MSHWIFQSTPKHFDLPRALQEVTAHDNVLTFLANQHTAEIAPGDTVYLCFGGEKKRAGLYAIATVQTRPSAIVPDQWQRHHAQGKEPHSADERKTTAPRVRFKIQRVLEVPIPRESLYRLRELSSHKFVKAHIGTNFLLADHQARAIEGLIAGEV